MRKKILYLTNGDSVHDKNMLSKISQHHDPIIVSYSLTKTPLQYPFPVIHKKFLPTFIPASTYINYLLGFPHLLYLIKKHRPDIIHSGWVQHYGFIASLTQFFHKIPHLSLPWGSDILIFPHKNRLYHIITKFVLNSADHICCDSQAVKSEIISLSSKNPSDITVFAQGVDQSIFHPKPSSIRQKLGWQDKKILIMTRNFHPVYDIPTFLFTLPVIIKAIPETRVILCGDGTLRPKIEAFITKNHLQDHIHLAGHISPSDLCDHLNASDIYISTSLSDGTSVSMLEAFCCGLPTIVTDVPSIMEWVNAENGFIIPKSHPEPLKNAIIKLLQDNQLRQKFSKENLKIAEQRCDWDKNFLSLLDAYENLTE